MTMNDQRTNKRIPESNDLVLTDKICALSLGGSVMDLNHFKVVFRLRSRTNPCKRIEREFVLTNGFVCIRQCSFLERYDQRKPFFNLNGIWRGNRNIWFIQKFIDACYFLDMLFFFQFIIITCIH
jgi:hypothetical protein